MSEHIISINDEQFEATVLQANLPVLVDFWAEWCQPCKQLTPVLEELTKEYKDRLIITKLNIDISPQVPTRFGIRSIPTLMLFKNGQVEATKIGSEPKSKLTTWLDRLL
jgi:thioredoxin 1